MSISPNEYQGNIVKAFHRRHGLYLFLRFHPRDAWELRKGLKPVLDRIVTSASRQHQITEEWKKDGCRTESKQVGMFGLAHSGYDALGRDGHYPNSEEYSPNHMMSGMKGEPDYLWDPEVTAWEEGLTEPHAYILVAHDCKSKLEDESVRIRSELKDVAEVVVEQFGHMPGDTDLFGFNDRVTNHPVPANVLTREPLTGGLGAFAAFAKIELNEAAFLKQSENASGIARELGVDLPSRRIQELAVGREKNGEPLVPHGPGGIDDFSFRRMDDSRCPYHAHIRVMNPRNGIGVNHIVRRGLVYGCPEKRAGRGVLFLSLQKTLLDFMGLIVMSQMRLDPILVRTQANPAFRPLNGCTAGTLANPTQSWPAGDQRFCAPMSNISQLRGGEYFYVPSMKFIAELQ